MDAVARDFVQNLLREPPTEGMGILDRLLGCDQAAAALSAVADNSYWRGTLTAQCRKGQQVRHRGCVIVHMLCLFTLTHCTHSHRMYSHVTGVGEQRADRAPIHTEHRTAIAASTYEC